MPIVIRDQMIGNGGGSGGTFCVLCGGMIGWHGDGQICLTAKNRKKRERPTLILT